MLGLGPVEPHIDLVAAREQLNGSNPLVPLSCPAGRLARPFSKVERSERPRFAVHVRVPLSWGGCALATSTNNCVTDSDGRPGGADAPLIVGTHAAAPTASTATAGTPYRARLPMYLMYPTYCSPPPPRMRAA